MSATAFYIPAPLIFAALALDALAGDPPWLPHPVVLIGRAISWGEYRLRSAQPRTDFLGGLLLAVCVTTLAGGAVWVDRVVRVSQSLALISRGRSCCMDNSRDAWTR
jgi:cobalamin biosynthesis protein CobD/CbiB